MKKLIMYFALFLITVIAVRAIPQQNLKQNSKYQGVAYEIIIPSKIVDGKLYPETTVPVRRVSDDYLVQNIIEVKTRNFEYVNFDDMYFENPNLKSLFSNITITSLKAPYSPYLTGNNLLAIDKFGLTRIYQIRYLENIDPYQLCEEINKNYDVEYATPVFKRDFYDFSPNDPRYGAAYQLTKIEMPKAWDISQGDTNIVIAIVDSGTDIYHEDIVGNLWTNPNEIPNNGIDDDGNGKIDDIHGWDFVGAITANQIANGQFQEDNDPSNNINTHGSHTAGCASAVTNNGIGVASPGFKCKLMPVKIATDGANVQGLYRGYEAMLYAAITGADVINCSWGGPGWSPTEMDIINQINNMGIVMVVAAGNSGVNLDKDPDYPAAYPGVLCVGSSSATDRPSGFSNYGNIVTVFAPGENIWSTVPGNKYVTNSGTSMSSPVTAGVVGLLKSIHKDWSPKQIIQHIRATSDNVLVQSNPSLRPYYYGRLNAYRALQYNNEEGKNIAGIAVDEYKVNNNFKYFNNYEMTPVSITLQNYLAADNNVSVKLVPVDNFIEFEQTDFNLGSMGEFDISEITTNAKLLDNNPWFRGFAEVIVEITGTDFKNYELISLDIRVPSDNKFSYYGSAKGYGITWHSSSFLDDNMIYLAGVSEIQQIGGVVAWGDGGSFGIMPVNLPGIYSVYAFNRMNLLAGDGPASGAASVFRSNNGGQSWVKNSVSHITNFINSFNFFNETKGLLLGDPTNSTWGVGRTTNGGDTWQLVQGMTPPLANETGLVGSIFQKGDAIWFGTTAGRIFKSDNQGDTWQTSTIVNGGIVYSLSFNESIAACLYSSSNAQNAPRFLSISKDGGSTWTPAVYNFTSNDQIPLTIYAIEETNTIIVQLFDGRLVASDNDGINWYPILSERNGDYIYAAANQFGNKVNMYSAGNNVSRLQFNFTPSVVKKTLSVIDGNSFVFEDTEINKFFDMTVKIENIGNTNVNIDDIIIETDENTEQNEIRVLIPRPKEVEPHKPAEIKLRFAPKTEGAKSAVLTINSDADNPILNIDLTGLALKGTSVREYSNSDNINIIPNPSSESIIISSDEINIFDKVLIMDLLGNEILRMRDIEPNKIIDISKLPIGTYNIIIENSNAKYTKKFSVIR